MASKDPVFAPREVFEQILEYSVIPTFDLIIDVPEKGILMVRRKIAPYAGKWALPGLRMFKNESIDDTLNRIAQKEAGVKVDLETKRLLGQFVGKFKTEHDRQDLSTGYAAKALSSDVQINTEHFSGHRYVYGPDEIPANSGAMYSYYLEAYFADKANGSTTA